MHAPTPLVEPVLPARRDELVFRAFGEQGHHVVKDPRSGAYFKLGPEESFLFSRLDGRQTVAETCRAFGRHFNQSLTDEDLEQFLTIAAESGFLRTPAAPPEARPSVPIPVRLPEPQRRQPAPAQTPAPKAEPEPTSRQSILYWRKSVFDPDALFTRLEPGLRFLWTRSFFIASAACVVAAAALSLLNRRELVGDFPLAWAAQWEVLLLVWLTLVVATALHEFAHGLTCKHYGGEVHEVGFLLMFFLPCFFCNVSDAWLFREKSKRLWVTLAGAWCDLCLWALALFVWRVTPPNTLPHHLAWVLLGVAGARVFFNFNPLLKLDGYYLLSDAIDVPNLRTRGVGRFMAHVRRLLWGAPCPPAEPRGRLLLAYGAAAWTYSVLFLCLMAAALVPWWGHLWGTAGAVAAVALGVMAGRGTLEGINDGEVGRMLTSRKARVLAWTACLGAVAAAACVVRVSERASGPFRLRAARRAEIRAPVAGFLREVYFDEGQDVAAGAVVLRMEVPDLDSRIARLEAQQAEAQAQNAVVRAGDPADAAGPRGGAEAGDVQYWRIRAGEAQVDKLVEEQLYLRDLRRKQPVASPLAGVLSTARLREKVGQFFHEGDLLCEVEDLTQLEAEVAVPEQEMAHVRPGQRVELKARAAPFDTLAAEVTWVAAVAKDPPPAPGAAGGAAAPGIGDVPGHVVVYCAVTRASSPEALAVVRPGMTGHARIDCGSQPAGKVLGLRFMRYVRTEFWW